MKVEITNTIDYAEYDEFLKHQSEATFYHSIKHLLFLQKTLSTKANFVTIRDDKTLIGVLPFFTRSTKFGTVVNSLPFFGSFGGFIGNDSDVLKKILATMNEYNNENDVLSSLIIANPFSKFHKEYTKYYDYNLHEERVIQCIPLNDKSVEVIWNEFEQRVRRAVRKGRKNNLEVTKISLEGESLEKFYQIHKLDMESKNGRAKPRSFFDNLNTFFESNVDYDLYCTKYKGEEIAYLLTFNFKNFVEYYMPAYDPNFKNLQGTSLILWESIKSSIIKNIEFYNFGGTWKTQEELYRFKRGWAALDMSYYYYIHGDVERIKKVGLNNLKKYYENFYVIDYDLMNSR